MQKQQRMREKWHLKVGDFGGKRAHAAQDWRYQMFFEYLRLSPSYAAATQCSSVEELAGALGDKERAALVWKTYTDVGNVFETLYRDWWLARGMEIFGIKTARPRVERVAQIAADGASADELLTVVGAEVTNFLSNPFTAQGKPQSLLISIPLSLKRVAISKQIKALLDAIDMSNVHVPQSGYVLEDNKMRYERLKMGMRLIYMRAARPKEELWRVAARARISKTHTTLDPNAQKKDANSSDARRMMTIMASRLQHDTLLIAENAAIGKFPSTAKVNAIPFAFEELGKRLQVMLKAESILKANIATYKENPNVK